MKKNDTSDAKAMLLGSTDVSSSIAEKQTSFPVAPSRETIGYVTSGRFLYSHACGAAVGFITLTSLRRLVQFQVNHQGLAKLFNSSIDFKEVPLLALVRNVDSTQYRFVKLKVIKPW